MDLSPVAETTLHLLSKNKPFFPEFLAKIISEQAGLECNEQLFYRLMSTTIDYKLKTAMNSIKESEEGKLKTSDIEKYFEGEKIPISKAHLYPELGVEKQPL